MRWEQRLYKNKDVVYMLVDDNGQVCLQEGKAEIRYQPNGRSYFALPKNLQPLQQLSLTLGTPPQEELPSPQEITLSTPEPSTPTTVAESQPNSTYLSLETTDNPKTPTSILASGLELIPIVIYADGACSGNPGPAGLGVYWRQGKLQKTLSEYLGHGTNNIAELTALKRALELCSDTHAPITIYTDSSYVIGLLTQHWKPKANQDLVKELRDLARQYKRLQLRKVRGHAGIYGNEQADMLARAAVVTKQTTTSETMDSSETLSEAAENSSLLQPTQTEADTLPESGHHA